MFNDLNDIRLFAQVVRQGSVTKGAAALGMPTATVSRRLSSLEQEVGARLVERDARRFELTEAGRAYYEAATRLVDELEAAAAAVSGVAAKPSGAIRLSAPPDFSVAFLSEPLARFAEAHPDIHLDIELSTRRVDLIDEGFDLAVRMGPLTDARLVCRLLTSLPRRLYASPEYVRRKGLPSSPDELDAHRYLALSAEAGAAINLTDGKRAVQVTPAPRLTVNAMPMLRQLLSMGAGIALVPDALVREEVKAGRLQCALPMWTASDIEAHLLYRSRTLLPQRVRLLVDHLVSAFPSD